MCFPLPVSTCPCVIFFPVVSIDRGFFFVPKSFQSCLTLCDLMDCSPPGFSVHGIFQARILEWVAMPSSRGSSQPRGRTSASCLLHLQASSLSVSHLGSLQEFTTRWQIKSLNVTMMHNSVFMPNIISIGNTMMHNSVFVSNIISIGNT